MSSFGYLDGVSNPAIVEFDKNIPPGPAPINAGHILLGETGDTLPRDPWMVDGSFLVFRYLFQKVPEFDDFLDRNALKMPGLTRKDGADLLGARLVGRWKSGTWPVSCCYHLVLVLIDWPDRRTSGHHSLRRRSRTRARLFKVSAS
jgi:hypothetical protein